MQRSKNRRGAFTVELAFCLPVLFAVVFAILEFSRVLQLQHSVRQAAFEGARAGMPVGATATDAQTAAANIAGILGVINPTITVSPNPIAYTSSSVTVTVQTTPAANGCFVWFMASNAPISATVSLIRETQAISVASP